ncbi:GntR family transcriptional regulator [Albimonas sp. CAU 1670]|uniref:GntR family transcriptional regulator n=1 Tax=Albimonas sp. CAU 1670 TaxID=3032599 RepID=UPI0023DAA2B3|nr:GntR family transcriptional regulator [Albimonas sp. CAU 1670]MDF2234995.1 GntR family transcriptional regulator [Albimonas sp. CAU 1670]
MRRPRTRPRAGAAAPARDNAKTPGAASARDDAQAAPPRGPLGPGGARPEADWARPLTRENLSEAAYRALRAALTEGRLKPGAPLPLRPMSRRFGISVTPMREAMLRLAGERALTIDARGAASVPVLVAGQVDEIAVLREDLEGRAAAQAALLATPAEIDALEAINADLVARHAAGDIPEAVRLNTRFHLAAGRLGGSPILAELIEGLWVRSGPLLWHSIDARAPRWRPGPHLDLLSALRAGDPDAAREAMRADAGRWARGYRRYAAPAD